jgi:hypothetical protein
MGGGFLSFGTRVSEGMPIYPCYLIFVTGKLNLFLKKFIILKATILFRQFWWFLGFQFEQHNDTNSPTIHLQMLSD